MSLRPNTSRLTAFAVGDILLGNIRPYLQKIWLADRVGGCSGDVLAIRVRPLVSDLILPAFLYRVLASNAFFAFNMQHVKGAKMPRGDKAAILRYQIPLPPIEIQQYVVATLSAFTKLEAELEARHAQYRYYRDILLSVGGKADSKVVTLDELYYSSSGLSKSADQFGFGEPFLSFKTVFHNALVPRELPNLVNTTEAEQKRYSIKKGDVFVTRTSEDLEGLGMSCAAIEDHPKATFNGFTKRLRPKVDGIIDLKYAAYFFRSALLRSQIAKMAILSTRVSLNDDILMRIKMPFPPLEEQKRIVSILDKFDALVNDLSSGLPAEIKARRQQYEHYCDQLLTFERAA